MSMTLMYVQVSYLVNVCYQKKKRMKVAIHRYLRCLPVLTTEVADLGLA